MQPDIAVFGEKDWQQLTVIRRMARDLDLTLPHPSRIFGVETVREADGLAMSSRNRYLSPEDRAAAAALPREMKAAVEAIEEGANVLAALEKLEVDLIDGRLRFDRLRDARRRAQPCAARRNAGPADAPVRRGADRRDAADRQPRGGSGPMTEEDFHSYVAAFNDSRFDDFGRFYADDVVFELGAMKRIVGARTSSPSTAT